MTISLKSFSHILRWILIGSFLNRAVLADPGLEIVIEEPQADAVAEVGAPLEVKAFLRNKSDHNIAIPIAGKLLNNTARVDILISNYPNQPESPSDAWGPGGGGNGVNGYADSQFITLKPGEKSQWISSRIIPMAPGNLLVMASYGNLVTGYMINQQDQFAPMPDAWKGHVSAERTLKSPNQLSEQNQKKLNELSDYVLNNSHSMEDRISKLKEITSLKHYFAARCLMGIIKKSNGPIRDATLDQLAELLDFGTAYEAFSDLLVELDDNRNSDEIRLKLLGAFKKMNLDTEYPGISIAGQAFYNLSPEQAESAVKVIKSIANGTNPKLAIQARKIALPLGK